MLEFFSGYNQALLGVVIVGVVAVIILVSGYYLLFLMQRQPARWQLDLEKRYRKILTKELDKKMLLLELDKLIEYSLKHRFNIRNKSFSEILKLKQKQFGKRDLDAVWAAHKLRNKLVHDIDFEPRPSEINHAIILYKKVINNFISS